MTTIKDNMKRLLDERASHWDATGKVLADIAETRDFTAGEESKFKEAEADFRAYSQRIETLGLSLTQENELAEFARSISGENGGVHTETRWINTDNGRPAALRSGEAFLSHENSRSGRDDSRDGALAQFGDLGEMIRALATTGGGTAIVPTVWSGNLIDLARSQSAVTRAGATFVPMNAKTVNIGRVTGDPTASFRAESATITPSDPTFDNVTLTAKSQSALVRGSREWFMDADNASAVVVDSLANAIAQNLDLAALYGGIITGAGAINLPTPPNPRGILAALNTDRPANVLGGGANGTTQSTAAYWAEIIDLLYTVRDGNQEPNAIVWSSKLGRLYAKATATDGQPLNIPAEVAAIPRFTVNKIPSYALGTNATATDAFVGDWSQLLIGQRGGLEISVETGRYAENGDIAVIAHWRGDVQPARASAFAVHRGLKGA